MSDEKNNSKVDFLKTIIVILSVIIFYCFLCFLFEIDGRKEYLENLAWAESLYAENKEIKEQNEILAAENEKLTTRLDELTDKYNTLVRDYNSIAMVQMESEEEE